MEILLEMGRNKNKKMV